ASLIVFSLFLRGVALDLHADSSARSVEYLIVLGAAVFVGAIAMVGVAVATNKTTGLISTGRDPHVGVAVATEASIGARGHAGRGALVAEIQQDACVQALLMLGCAGVESIAAWVWLVWYIIVLVHIRGVIDERALRCR